MDIKVTADEDSGEVISEFYRWLTSDTAVVRSTTVSLEDRTTGEGRMGALDIINVVLSNTTALASLAIAYASWRNSRPEPREKAPKLRFTRGEVSVEVRDASPETIEQITKLFSPRPNGDA